jgi:PAS domain S-box-containing protein
VDTPIVLSGDGLPPWGEGLARVRIVDPAAADDVLRDAAAAAPCALVDAALPEPLATARRLHAADPSLQVVIVVAPEARPRLERAMLFAPGLGEVWVVEPAQADAGLVKRARGVTGQRRRYRSTRRIVKAHLDSVEPRHDARARVSDAFLAALLDVLPDPVFSIDEEGKILSWNPAAERATGTNRRDAIGRPAEEVVHPEPAEDFSALLDRGARAPAAGETGFRRIEGEAGIAEVSVVPVEAAGHRVRAVVLHDVTQQRETQSELEAQASELEAQAAELEALNVEITARSDELESALATRSRFYAAMSHELRTPINAIIGYTSLILDGVFGPLEGRQEEGLRRSHRAAEHLMELVNDVLDLAKIEAGRIDLHPEPTEIHRLLRELLDTVAPLAESHRTRVEADLHGCPELRTDPRRVRQILLNLLSNAIKFGGGEPVTVSCGQADGGVFVEVTDRGRGIAPEHQESIFEEFVQVDRETATGTGLGLPISRRLAELLGGRLTVRSAAGEGSTFRLELPADPPAWRRVGGDAVGAAT